MSAIPQRLERLRERLDSLGLSHYLVPSADEHLNEYLPRWSERREWLSGFSGSAGDLLVGRDERDSLLFTDGRYHVQAERELNGSGIGLMKVGSRDAKSLPRHLEALAQERRGDLRVGYDPMLWSAAAIAALEPTLARHGATLVAHPENLVDLLWVDRPSRPTSTLIECPVAWTGRTAGEKIDALAAELERHGADAMVVMKLDQIAWLTNLRSLDDVPYNPVFESCAVLVRGALHLFLRNPAARLPRGYSERTPQLVAHEMSGFFPFLRALDGDAVLIDPERTSQGVALELRANTRVRVVEAMSPIETTKAIKNDAELECMKRANLMASVAKTRALLWLEEQVECSRAVSERAFLERIEGLYGELPGYRGQSFHTISSAGDHGAIIHYSGADATPLEQGQLFLIDSGIQFDGGTTDDTRTVIVGEPTADQRRVYTLVAQAFVRGASFVFPEGTSGAAVDAVTRSGMWAHELHYDHGTGHGVGAFLNVHEGPFGIAETSRRSYASLPLKPGMITSIEPGYYRIGFGGVRLENLYVVVDKGESEGRRWLGFEPLTYIPLDGRLLDFDLLSKEERAWIVRYHAECERRLAPCLSEPERDRMREWIEALTSR